MLDRLIEEKYEKWYEIGQKSDNNKEAILEILKSNLDSNFVKIDSGQYNNRLLKSLRFILTDLKLDIHVNTKEVRLMGTANFVKMFGGRVGYVHGGGSFTLLYLCIELLILICFSEGYSYKSVYTSYLKPIDIDSFVFIKLEYKNPTNLIVAELIDYESKVCARVEAKLIYLNKF
jgi:hypothetical protein